MIIIYVNASVKSIACVKKILVGILACICENGEDLKRTADTSVILHDEIIYDTDSVSTNVTNTIPTNMTNTVSTNVTSNVSINSGERKSNV